MGRKKIGVDQVKFDFAITPKSEHEKYVVERLQMMKDSNSFSAWIKDLIYVALPLPEDKPTVRPIEPTKGKVERGSDSPLPPTKQQSKTAAPGRATPKGDGTYPMGYSRKRDIHVPGTPVTHNGNGDNDGS